MSLHHLSPYNKTQIVLYAYRLPPGGPTPTHCGLSRLRFVFSIDSIRILSESAIQSL